MIYHMLFIFTDNTWLSVIFISTLFTQIEKLPFICENAEWKWHFEVQQKTQKLKIVQRTATLFVSIEVQREKLNNIFIYSHCYLFYLKVSRTTSHIHEMVLKNIYEFLYYFRNGKSKCNQHLKKYFCFIKQYVFALYISHMSLSLFTYASICVQSLFKGQNITCLCNLCIRSHIFSPFIAFVSKVLYFHSVLIIARNSFRCEGNGNEKRKRIFYYTYLMLHAMQANEE